MVVVSVSRAAARDLDRVRTFLEEIVGIEAQQTLEQIFEALKVLEHHPEIGRPLPDGQRELVILQGKAGFVALYKFDPRRQRVLVARIRHQREVGYPAR